MVRRGMLQGKEGDLVKDLKKTTLTFEKLGEKYGVSRQAVHDFCRGRGIKRPKRPTGHQPRKCPLCQKLIQISKRPRSEFISIHTIVKEMGERKQKCVYHLRRLKDRGLISQRFGRLRSRRAEKAYAIYFTKRLPVETIGREVGIKNFHSVIRRYRALGYDVPPSPYGGRGKIGIQSKIQGRKRR